MSNTKKTQVSRRRFISVGATVATLGTLAFNSKNLHSLSSIIPSVHAQTSDQPRGISDIYYVGGFHDPSGGRHEGLEYLFNLMGSNGLRLLKSQNTGSIYGPDGLIESDDVVLIKNNCQWPERGGTNTDLLKELIHTILQHPDVFTGEIVVADNGQGRGSFVWNNANAKDIAQCTQDVVDSFSGEKVSTFLWDTIRGNRVQEYDQGDNQDGYVHESSSEPITGMRYNYPKFRTSFDSYVSLKNGIWDPNTASYSDKLKLINFPVLKTHSGAGVTACIKHYMGVVSQSMQDNHNFIWNGGLAAEMAQIRFPTLNILDAVHVNPIPKETGNAGPRTLYSDAVKVNKLAASTDPIALDYWSSKNILMPVTRSLGYTSYESMNPDNPDKRFHKTLNNSMNVLLAYGYQATMDPSQIRIYSSYASQVADLSNFPTLPENNTYFIYPDFEGDKPSGVNYATLSDWTSMGYVAGMCENRQCEVTDTNSVTIDTNTGQPQLQDKTLVLGGGPLVNAPINYYEDRRLAPLYWRNINGVNYWYRADGTRIDETALSYTQIDQGRDMFVIESFIDEVGNRVLVIYGYGWKGTFAGGKFFKFDICPNIDNFTDSYYIYEWVDTGDGFVDLDEINPAPIVQG
jgi:uncharacterized protein (DUF362 family)